MLILTVESSPAPQLLHGCIATETKALYLALRYIVFMLFDGSGSPDLIQSSAVLSDGRDDTRSAGAHDFPRCVSV